MAPPVPEQDLPDQTAVRFSEALHRYWGYESFRAGQENIVKSIAAGRDACVVMPTGGGKSLCYQLPAVLDSHRTAVVVSPLIALMQDQVAHLEQMGVPAGFLNSSLSSDQRGVILRRASEGHYRLLYLSPERITLDGTPAWLGRVPASFFAIDEAHCISEWGHDFRPEYRQLSRLRELFPDCPIAAFTASATQRVRHDIIEQLRLRDPYKHIASFRRPNLRYIVRQCDARTQNELLLRAVKQISDGSVIVYAPTVARVGDTVDFLEENGIAAIGYHGQMDSAARRENQEKWMADEVRVMVGTMAFGLGINKASVRTVIHLSLPKSVEQYYQEAGRAGRDALPADCFLFGKRKTPACTPFLWVKSKIPGKRNAPGSDITKSSASCNPRSAASVTSAATSANLRSGTPAAIAMPAPSRRTGWKLSCKRHEVSAASHAKRSQHARSSHFLPRLS